MKLFDGVYYSAHGTVIPMAYAQEANIPLSSVVPARHVEYVWDFRGVGNYWYLDAPRYVSSNDLGIVAAPTAPASRGHWTVVAFKDSNVVGLYGLKIPFVLVVNKATLQVGLALDIGDWGGAMGGGSAFGVFTDFNLTAAQVAVTVTPTTSSVSVGSSVIFTASGGSGTGAYTWGGDGSGTGTTKAVTFNTVGTRTVTVYRAASTGYNVSNTATATITVTDPPAYTLTVSRSPAEGGVVSGGGTYAGGSSNAISATAASGWRFLGWTFTGGVSGGNAAASSTSVVLNSNGSAIANFVRATVTLAVSTTGPGTTSPTGSVTYNFNEIATVTATPEAGARFVSWAGDSTSTNSTINVTMTANRSVTAIFQAKNPQTITFDLPALKIHAVPFVLSATATSGLPVTLTYDTGPAVLSGNPTSGYTLLVHGAGVISITATQGGSELWMPAEPVSRSAAIGAQKLIINDDSAKLKVLQGGEGEVPKFGK
jgi:hypothetical protein